MVQAILVRDDAEEPLIGDKEEEGDAVSFGDIAREFSIMGWIGFGGECLEAGGSQPILSRPLSQLTRLQSRFARRASGSHRALPKGMRWAVETEYS